MLIKSRTRTIKLWTHLLSLEREKKRLNLLLRLIDEEMFCSFPHLSPQLYSLCSYRKQGRDCSSPQLYFARKASTNRQMMPLSPQLYCSWTPTRSRPLRRKGAARSEERKANPSLGRSRPQSSPNTNATGSKTAESARNADPTPAHNRSVTTMERSNRAAGRSRLMTALACTMAGDLVRRSNACFDEGTSSTFFRKLLISPRPYSRGR